MIGYLKSNIFNFIIGVVIGIPVSLYVVHEQQQNVPWYIENRPQPEICMLPQEEQQKSLENINLNINFQNYETTDEELAEEAYYDSLELLAMCVEAEAGNQGLIGKKYVVDVVLNRVDDEDFPDSITDVIMQQNQFSVVLDGRIWQTVPTEETFQAVREELESRTNYQVLFFTCEGYSEYGTPWEKIGDHYFSVKGR